MKQALARLMNQAKNLQGMRAIRRQAPAAGSGVRRESRKCAVQRARGGTNKEKIDGRTLFQKDYSKEKKSKRKDSLMSS